MAVGSTLALEARSVAPGCGRTPESAESGCVTPSSTELWSLCDSLSCSAGSSAYAVSSSGPLSSSESAKYTCPSSKVSLLQSMPSTRLMCSAEGGGAAARGCGCTCAGS